MAAPRPAHVLTARAIRRPEGLRPDAAGSATSPVPAAATIGAIEAYLAGVDIAHQPRQAAGSKLECRSGTPGRIEMPIRCCLNG